MELREFTTEELKAVKLPKWFVKADTQERAEAIKAGRITDHAMLHRIARLETEWQVTCAAVERIATEKSDASDIALADIALHGRDVCARRCAAGSLHRQALLYTLSMQTNDAAVRMIATKKLSAETAAAHEKG